MITHAYLDLDSVAYIGACIAAKRAYRFRNSVTGEFTEEFSSAKLAKNWLTTEEAFEDLDEDTEEDKGEWVRETIIKRQPVEVAIKATVNELKTWISVAKRLTGNKDIIIKGYLTSSGAKDKDKSGLEDRYQCNRYKDKIDWVPIDKPEHLSACRDHLITSYDWIKMSPKGIEADAVVIYQAEKKGKKAVVMSKDKDLKQAMDTYFIDMNPKPNKVELEYCSSLGELTIKLNLKKQKIVKGNGFKLLCLQTIVGDPSDGYYGVRDVGALTAYGLFSECKSVEECCKVLCDEYKKRFEEGLTYKSWDNKVVTLSWQELLKQHFELAYHPRGAKDKSTPIERYLNGEEVLKN